jgi:hypothetical protein
VDRAVDETRRLLRDSRIGPADLAGIFLVGGASRMPLVASRLHARLGVAPAVPEQPELPVAYGALPVADTPARAQPTTTMDIGHVATTPVARPRRARMLVGVVAALALVLAGSLWWYAGRNAAAGAWRNPVADVSSSPTGTPKTTAGRAVPTGFVSCADGRLCPTTATCWGGPVIIAGTATARRIDCGKPHYIETFVAGYLAADAVGVDFFELQKRADIMQLCANSVLLTRLRSSTTTGTWEWRALPVQVGGDWVVHCIADRKGENARTGSLFRTGA